ncbi:cypmaclein [Elaeis guineensis]|uniref:Gibberellin-regulated protein 14 n=1 Tax=Elaeis guineensis var. tenera TaxID=51953 RepID=A0A6I9QQM3_ELAGV|nr:gibberellin-regulated protein 14 [Elaeis guineensis]
MALRALLFTVVLLCILPEAPFDRAVVEADPMIPRGGNGKAVLDCTGLCGVRCGRHSRPNVCLRACGTCCFRCKCVPPGTSGNREMCGTCYTNMTTHNNRTKCP